MNAGMQIKSIPLGATKPRAIATAFTDWFSAPAPIAWISAHPLSRITPARAPATEFGLDFAETFKTSKYVTSQHHILIRLMMVLFYMLNRNPLSKGIFIPE